MNKERRKAIEEIIDQLGTLKEQIESVSEEESEAYDNLPESIQYSEKGEAISENASDLEQAASDLDDIMSTLQDIMRGWPRNDGAPCRTSGFTDRTGDSICQDMSGEEESHHIGDGEFHQCSSSS